MKKIAILLSLLSVLVFSPTVYANLVNVGDLVSRGEIGALGGGEMTIINQTTGVTFRTFCLEVAFALSGQDFYVADISNNVLSGGPGQTGEPLSGGTKWLFYNWAMGTLPGYNRTDQTIYGENALQLAIWYLQGDLNSAWTPTYDGGYFYSLAAQHLSDGLLLPVYAVNPIGPWPLYSGDAQSFLVTPEPLTILMLGAGLIGLAGLRRKEQE
jgi:hypothetical protein